MSQQKLSEAKSLHPRNRRSPRYQTWKRSVSNGMRRAAKRRRAAGLATFQEVAVKTLHPVYALRQMADAGQLKVVRRGARCYIPVSEIKRLKAA